MALQKQRSGIQGLNEANITPLADVTTTLIVVFLITMPALMWNGFQVNQARTGGEQAEVSPGKSDEEGLLTVAVKPDGLTLDGKPVEKTHLEEVLTGQLALRRDKTVVIVPDDMVALGTVVGVLDIAKASGAESLAILNEIGR
jgi:biopolymer transport protein ExbD